MTDPVQLQHLAGRVWIYPHDPDSANVQGCVAVIAGDGSSVVVDAGNSPSMARDVQRAMQAAGLPPAGTVIVTHHHWDHTWGACAWPQAELVAHESGRRLLETDAARPWGDAYLRDAVAENPRLGPSFAARARAMSTWEGFSVRLPDRTFHDGLDLPGGVQVRHVGGRHSEDSTVVAVPDSRVLLLGDCCYPPPLHLRRPEDGPDLHLLRALTDERYDWYVDSHDAPHRREDALAWLATQDTL